MVEIKQDLPPAGGYAAVNWTRVPAKKFFTGYQMIAGYLGLFAFGFWLTNRMHKVFRIRKVENRSCYNAIFPLLLAERDREFLKQLSRNRDEEAKLMKNVEGWKVGQYYDLPIYEHPDRGLTSPIISEFYAHADPKYLWERLNYAMNK
ncbi:NADH dehydrogenase [ubiquinone] 1 alpha subcomplex subunit 13-like [Pollicipes pollicipes]|uniref:NADH dehydrogenase [ubiquinone] 1 alpha subcomplex subunit 13-like n=1 Tax=Pollicipes pollicipes TaxID=41117 RepID=UPI001884D48A|nr:NADH dehydrogenase [ubiquinone] 1 alpha subcomplex subunit 13-like [Pollicipes pollicipes]